MNDLLKKLTGGDRRSIGRSEEVVAEVLADPALFPLVFEGMLSDDPLIRMRAADAVEKISANRPEYLQPYQSRLIEEVAGINQQEIRWHVAQMLPRLKWNAIEQLQVVELLLDYLKDSSKIVKTLAMQALADLAEQEENLRPQVTNLLEELTQTGSPAMQSRGKKLLRRLSQTTAQSHMTASPTLDSLTTTTIATIQQFNEALNRRDIEGMLALLSEDCVFENTYPAPDGTRYEGQDEVRRFWIEFFAASTRAAIETEEIFATGERGVMRWVYHWIDPEGQPGYIRGVDVYRVHQGRVAEKLSYVKG